MHFTHFYSPDYNPIEECLSYRKYYLKEHVDLIQELPNPIPIIEAALDGVTSSKCNGWINDSGYDRRLVTACWYMMYDMQFVYNMTTPTYICEVVTTLLVCIIL